MSAISSGNGFLKSVFAIFVAVIIFKWSMPMVSVGPGNAFLGLMMFLLAMSLMTMLSMSFLHKMGAIEPEEGRFLDETIFVLCTSLFGLILFLPVSYHMNMTGYTSEWWIFHIIGATALLSLILTEITVRIIDGKVPRLFEENKKQEKITLAG